MDAKTCASRGTPTNPKLHKRAKVGHQGARLYLRDGDREILHLSQKSGKWSQWGCSLLAAQDSSINEVVTD